MATVIKLYVREKTQYPSSRYVDGKSEPTIVNGVKMNVTMGGPDQSEENKRFFASTPSGTVEFGTVNHDAAEMFALGSECYAVFMTPDEYTAFRSVPPTEG